jgi:hypothetical protein
VPLERLERPDDELRAKRVAQARYSRKSRALAKLSRISQELGHGVALTREEAGATYDVLYRRICVLLRESPPVTLADVDAYREALAGLVEARAGIALLAAGGQTVVVSAEERVRRLGEARAAAGLTPYRELTNQQEVTRGETEPATHTDVQT